MQRFGDRLDILATDPDEATRVVKAKMDAANLPIGELYTDSPRSKTRSSQRFAAWGRKCTTRPFRAATITPACAAKSPSTPPI